MASTGIMEQIRSLLSQGKSSRQVIDLGYRPGSVYKVQREMRHNDGALAGVAENHWVYWHADPPLACPGCGQSVVHWSVCLLCSRLLPCDCACPEDAPSQSHGYSLSELLGGATS